MAEKFGLSALKWKKFHFFIPWLIGLFIAASVILTLGLIASLIVQIVVVPPAPPHLTIEADIPMPGAFSDHWDEVGGPLVPGLTVPFDRFEFQAIDPRTRLLFIAHTGPSPERESQVNSAFDLDTGMKTDGNVVVFDTVHKKIVDLLPIPQVTGLVVASDLHKVFAADSHDSRVFVIDEETFTYTSFALQHFDHPNALEYDARDHLLLVSNPGMPAHPSTSLVIARKNQNITIVDALTNRIRGRIALGIDGKWGDAIGYLRYDPALRLAFVVEQQLPDPYHQDLDAYFSPHSAWMVVFNPVTRQVLQRIGLPAACVTPHSLAIDEAEEIAILACVNSDPPSLVRVDLRTMKVFQEPLWPVEVKPDMLVIDEGSRLLYVGCGVGISIFRLEGRKLVWLESPILGMNTHTIAVNSQTHEIYIPLAKEGDRPVLRIMRYHPPE